MPRAKSPLAGPVDNGLFGAAAAAQQPAIGSGAPYPLRVPTKADLQRIAERVAPARSPAAVYLNAR